MLKLGLKSRLFICFAIPAAVFVIGMKISKIDNKSTILDHKLSVIPILREGKISCSSVVISDTTALTARHCIVKEFGGATMFGFLPEVLFKSVKVLSPKGVIKTKVYAHSSSMLDLAILKGDFKAVPKNVTLGSASALDSLFSRSFDSFQSCGYLLGLSKVYCAIHSKVSNTGHFVESRGALFNGMSGGPLLWFDKGQAIVIGINSNINTLTLNTYFSPILSVEQLEEYFKVKL